MKLPGTSNIATWVFLFSLVVFSESFAQELDYFRLQANYNHTIDSLNKIKASNPDAVLAALYGMVDEYYVFPDLFFQLANANAEQSNCDAVCACAFMGKELGSENAMKSYMKNKCDKSILTWSKELAKFKSSKNETITFLSVTSGTQAGTKFNVGQLYTLKEGKTKKIVTLERIENYSFDWGLFFIDEKGGPLVMLYNAIGNKGEIELFLDSGVVK